MFFFIFYYVFVCVFIVGFNLIDYKMVMYFYMEGNIVGCDFCGIVVDVGFFLGIFFGIKVIGVDFFYCLNNFDNGVFVEYVVSDVC